MLTVDKSELLPRDAKCGLAIACKGRLSVSNVGGSGSHSLEISETNCMDNYPNTFTLRSLKATHLLPGKHGEIFGKLKILQS